MRIDSIALSIFQVPSNTGQFDLVEEERGATRRWLRAPRGSIDGEVHVLHVRTDDGIEGICTVGDARYTTMRRLDLEQLRILALGEDAIDRERLYHKMAKATRGMFAKPGWFGAFDNCLWDIAGQAAGLPVYALMGRARTQCPAYYNIRGAGLDDVDAAIASAQQALSLGFPAVKDHFHDTVPRNIRLFERVRAVVGDEIDLMHDAASCPYTFDGARRVGRALEAQGYGWFEEPLEDADQASLIRLCEALDIPVVAPETMMHDVKLSAQWLISGATDAIRANGRHGATSVLKLAHLAELHDARVELNGPGGLYGLVHAHLVCAISNTSYYEYFPGGSRDEAGKQIGLLNPPVPCKGHIAPPDLPG